MNYLLIIGLKALFIWVYVDAEKDMCLIYLSKLSKHLSANIRSIKKALFIKSVGVELIKWKKMIHLWFIYDNLL